MNKAPTSLLATAVISLTLTLPVLAKVKKVEVADDGPLGQTPSIEVIQTRDANGLLRYSHFEVNGTLVEPSVNLKVQVSAQCKVGYLLSAAELVTPPTEYCGASSDFDTVNYCGGTYYGGQHHSSEPFVKQVPYTKGNRTLGKRLEDFQVPLEYFIGLINYGNDAVAERADNAFHEEQIRAEDWVEWVPVDLGFNVRCKRAVGYTGIDKWWKGDTITQQVRVTYRGASAGSRYDGFRSPTNDRRFHELPGGARLTDGVRVEADLIALPSTNPASCGLELSGTINTTDATTVHYRLVDNKGAMSPLFEVPVDHTHTAFVHHHVDLSSREPEDPETGRASAFAALSSAKDIGSFTAGATDRIQGYYQIEVVVPYRTTSSTASFNLEPCTTAN